MKINDFSWTLPIREQRLQGKLTPQNLERKMSPESRSHYVITWTNATRSISWSKHCDHFDVLLEAQYGQAWVRETSWGHHCGDHPYMHEFTSRNSTVNSHTKDLRKINQYELGPKHSHKKSLLSKEKTLQSLSPAEKNIPHLLPTLLSHLRRRIKAIPWENNCEDHRPKTQVLWSYYINRMLHLSYILPPYWESSNVTIVDYNSNNWKTLTLSEEDCFLLCLVIPSWPTLHDPMDCSPPGSSVCGDSPGKNTGVGCHVLLQRNFLTQESNLGLLHYRQIL